MTEPPSIEAIVMAWKIGVSIERRVKHRENEIWGSWSPYEQRSVHIPDFIDRLHDAGIDVQFRIKPND